MNGEQVQPRRRRFIVWPLAIAALIAGLQYFSSQRYVNPETGRAARVALSEGQESALGLQSYEDVLSQSQVVNSGPEVEMVQKVMKRLEAATGEAGKNMDWQVSVVASPQVNAFCLPGGKWWSTRALFPSPKPKLAWRRCWGTKWLMRQAATVPSACSKAGFHKRC